MKFSKVTGNRQVMANANDLIALVWYRLTSPAKIAWVIKLEHKYLKQNNLFSFVNMKTTWFYFYNGK